MMTIKVTLTPKQPAERMELFQEYFGKYLQDMHNACCLYILEMCVQWTRVDTGRLRSGWLPFMIAHNHNYERSLGPIRKDVDDATSEGISESRFQEGYLSLYVENGVNYAGYVDNALRGLNGGMFDMTGQHSFKPSPVGTFQAAVPLFAEQYASRMEKLFQNADEWLDKIMKGDSPDQIDVPSDLGPPELTN